MMRVPLMPKGMTDYTNACQHASVTLVVGATFFTLRRWSESTPGALLALQHWTLLLHFGTNSKLRMRQPSEAWYAFCVRLRILTTPCPAYMKSHLYRHGCRLHVFWLLMMTASQEHADLSYELWR